MAVLLPADDDEPIYAQDSYLGIALCGALFPHHCNSIKKVRYTVNTSFDQLNERLSRFFSLESIGICGDPDSEFTPDEVKAMEDIKKVTIPDEYQVFRFINILSTLCKFLYKKVILRSGR